MSFGWVRPGREQAKSRHLFHCDAYRKGSVHFHASDFGDFSMFLHRPQLFQDLVELFLVGHGKHFLVGNFAVMQFDSAIGEAGHDGIMSHHHDGASLVMQFAQKTQYDLFINRIQISRRLIGQNNFGIVDQSTCDTNALLFSAGKLRGQMAARSLRPTCARAARASGSSVMLWKYCVAQQIEPQLIIVAIGDRRRLVQSHLTSSANPWPWRD